MEQLKGIKYYVHYIYNDDDTLDSLFIDHNQTVFASESETLELSMKQFESFIKTVHNVHVDWSNSTMTPSQWKEYYEEKASM